MKSSREFRRPQRSMMYAVCRDHQMTSPQKISDKGNPMFLGVPSLDLLKGGNAPYNEPESFEHNPPCFPQERPLFYQLLIVQYNHFCGRIA